MSFALLAQILTKVGDVATSVATAITNIGGVQTTANSIRSEATTARDYLYAWIVGSRDDIIGVTNAARDNVKTHVTAAVAGISSSAIKSVQTIAVTQNFGSVGGGLGGGGYCDIAIAAVNQSKAFVINGRPMYGSTNQYFCVYRLISPTVVRAEVFGGTPGAGQYIAFTVVESN